MFLDVFVIKFDTKEYILFCIKRAKVTGELRLLLLFNEDIISLYSSVLLTLILIRYMNIACSSYCTLTSDV